MNFWDAMTTKDTLTENDMPTHSYSGSFLLDYFFKVGAARQSSPNDIISWFNGAFSEHPLNAVKILFYNRDIRGGQGERRSFLIVAKYLALVHPQIYLRNLQFIPEFGRWDDVWKTGLFNETTEKLVANFLYESLNNGLNGKWLPRENKQFKIYAKELMKLWQVSPYQYRKMIVEATKPETVETQMCKNEWPQVNYNAVPSIAIKKYRKAFNKHDHDRYEAWVTSLSKPESGNKINAVAIFPHDIVKAVFKEIPVLSLNFSHINTSSITLEMLNQQWKALPNYGTVDNTLVVSDVSGSMFCDNNTPIAASLALGIYFSERIKSKSFRNIVITFSRNPKFHKISGDKLVEKIASMYHTDWGENTNLEAVFRLVLEQALKNKLEPENMPANILILSDMQFDECVQEPNNTALEMIKRMYNESGYKIPNVIFWNLRTSVGIPVKITDSGVIVLSGYSPASMQYVLSGEMNPMSILNRVLSNERYSKITL